MRFFQRTSAVLLCALTLSVCGCAGEKPNEPANSFVYRTARQDCKTDGQYYQNENVELPASLWQTPQAERYESLDHGEIKAYFIDSVQNTKVFCYVGIPETATPQNKVPAVVLVHGATGTAFYDWVQLWVNYGYAAIAMDTEGRMPTAQSSTVDPDFANCSASIKPHGPVNAAFTDCSSPVEQQWVYHALASVVASASFISSFDAVDGGKLGITGVSYGGFLTSLAIGYDDRFSFAAPVYGCLSNVPAAAEFGSYMQGAAATLWDGVAPLQMSRTPVLFVNSATDRFFAPDSTSRSAAACADGAISFKPEFLHGHYQGANASEVFAFADEIFFARNALLRIKGDASQGYVRVQLPPDRKIRTAKLYYTFSDTLNDQTEWMSARADVIGDKVVFDLYESYKHYYVSIKDDRGYYVSSGVVSSIVSD